MCQPYGQVVSGLTNHSRCFEVNPAYNLFEEDGFDFGTMAALVLLIILAGYLIIYNIFLISIQTDIRIYGLLKNIGTTGKQLKKIVRGIVAVQFRKMQRESVVERIRSM